MMRATLNTGPITLATAAVVLVAGGCGTVATAPPKADMAAVRQVPGTVVALGPLVRAQIEGIIERATVDGTVSVASERGLLRLPVTPPTRLAIGELVRVHIAAQPAALRADDVDDDPLPGPAALPAAAVERPRTLSTAIGSVRRITADGRLAVDVSRGTTTVWVPSAEIFKQGDLAQVWTWIEPLA